MFSLTITINNTHLSGAINGFIIAFVFCLGIGAFLALVGSLLSLGSSGGSSIIRDNIKGFVIYTFAFAVIGALLAGVGLGMFAQIAATIAIFVLYIVIYQVFEKKRRNRSFR
jgi:hypothetical protein